MRVGKLGVWGLGCWAIVATAAMGQQLSEARLPDSPGAAISGTPEDAGQQAGTQSAQTAPTGGAQTKRILGILPNFKSVSVDQNLPPMTVKDKFIEASQDNFDYSSIVLPALVALYDLKRNSTPEFGHGGLGYGRYLWHSVVDQTSENYFVEFIVPVATHEDPRYYTLGRGGFGKRAIYSLSRVLITRKDDGGTEFNASEILGAGMSAGLSNLYYPSRERTFGNTATQWGTDIGIDALSLMVKEFWPDINQKLFHGKE